MCSPPHAIPSLAVEGESTRFPIRRVFCVGRNYSEHAREVPDVISHVSRSVKLQAGDLIFTGTPAGVGPLVAGDRVSAGIEGIATFELSIG